MVRGTEEREGCCWVDACLWGVEVVWGGLYANGSARSFMNGWVKRVSFRWEIVTLVVNEAIGSIGWIAGGNHSYEQQQAPFAA